MPRRKSPFPEKPYDPPPETIEKFRVFMAPKKQKELKPPWIEPKDGWMLFRWDTLEDVKQG